MRSTLKLFLLVPPLICVLLLPVALAVPAGGARAGALHMAPGAAPHAGEGNHIQIGSRESGLYLDLTISGIDLRKPSYEGYGRHSTSGPFTAAVVTMQGTLYNAMGPNLVTRATMVAKLGTNGDCDNAGSVSWPPPERVDAQGLVGGPFEQELPFSLTYQLQPGDAKVCFFAQVGKNGGVYEGWGVSGYGYVDPANPPLPAEPPAPTPTAPPTPLPASERGKPPCVDPLSFYPDTDLSSFYAGQPSLNYDCQGLGRQLVDALRRYQGEGGSLSDGTRMMDVKDVAMTLVNGRLRTGQEAALQQAARDLARQGQQTDPGYRLKPGTFFYLSLKLNNGNVRDALLTCHAALARTKGAKASSAANRKFVEDEGVLGPIRNVDGYSDAPFTYTTAGGLSKTADPRAIGKDEQGVWYHLFGTAALEYVDRYGAAAYYAAQYKLRGQTDAVGKAAEQLAKKGFPVTGHGGWLGDYAIALEQEVRSGEGSPPDVDKNCINYWGLVAGRELRDRVLYALGLQAGKPMDAGIDCPGAAVAPEAGITWDPRAQFDPNATEVTTPSGAVLVKSPLSVRIDGTGGEWFTFDQATKQFDGNTPLVLLAVEPEDDGTWALVAAPLFQILSVQLTGVGQGPATLGLYDSTSRIASVYEVDVQPGDLISVPWLDRGRVAYHNDSLLIPSTSETVSRPFPLLPAAAGAGGLLLLAVVGVVAVGRRRSTRAPRATPIRAMASPAPLAAPGERPVPMGVSHAAGGQAVCRGCGEPLKPEIRFCGTCGTPVPEPPRPARHGQPAVCPTCSAALPPGVHFCGTCGAALAAAPIPDRQEVDPRPMTQAEAEPVLGVWSQLGLRKGPLAVHEYNLILTPRHLAFARVSTKMLQEAAMQASTGARDWLCRRQAQMSLESILAEHPDSFAVPLAEVRQARVRFETDADDNETETLEVQTVSAKLRFTLPGGSGQRVQGGLKQALGDRLR